MAVELILKGRGSSASKGRKPPDLAEQSYKRKKRKKKDLAQAEEDVEEEALDRDRDRDSDRDRDRDRDRGRDRKDTDRDRDKPHKPRKPRKPRKEKTDKPNARKPDVDINGDGGNGEGPSQSPNDDEDVEMDSAVFDRRWPAQAEKLEDVRGLRFVQLMNGREFKQLTIDALHDFFRCFGDSSNGEEGGASLVVNCLWHAFTIPDKLFSDKLDSDEADALLGELRDARGGTGRVTAPDLFIALEKCVSEILDPPPEAVEDDQNSRHSSRHRAGTLYDDDIPDEQVRGIVIDRKLFCEIVSETVERDDAFLTLPFTLVYFVVWVVLVMFNLSIYERQLMEKSLEDWVNGRDPKEQADLNIDDLDSFWEWVQGTGIPSILDSSRSGTADPAHKHYFLSTRHVFVGDIFMNYETCKGEPSEIDWLLHNQTTKLLVNNNSMHMRDARKAAEALQIGSWKGRDICIAYFGFVTYDERATAFCITTAMVRMNVYGETLPIMNADCVFVNKQFLNPWVMTLCGIFFLMAFWMFITEAKDLLTSLCLGCGEFCDYWSIWNIVDWVSIGGAAGYCALLGLMWTSTQDATITEFLDEDGLLAKDPMGTGLEAVEQLVEQVVLVRNIYTATHYMCAINTLAIVAKFFKSFQSNPRLKVVTDTFSEAATDLAHFFIIFTTLFLPFAVIGHVLFGKDIPEMGSVMASINTCLALLMGDFSWYTEVAPEHIGALLPSGMPTVLLFLWFFLFNFLMVLVVLNMLLAVVLEHYQVVTTLLKSEPDAMPIWVQVIRFGRVRKQTRGFITFKRLDTLLQNDDDPAHQDDEVSEESLLNAFEGMKSEQASWLMQHLQKKVWLREKANENLNSSGPNTANAILESAEKQRLEFELLHSKVEQATVASINDDIQALAAIIDELGKEVERVQKGVMTARGRKSVRSVQGRPSVWTAR